LEQAIFYNFLIAALALVLTWIFGGPKIDIEPKTALAISSILAIAFFCVIIFGLNAKRKKRIENDDWHRTIRYPVYSAIVFFLNPALAIIFRSWLLVLAIIPLYFIWGNVARSKDLTLSKEQGNKHREYRMSTSMLLPKIMNKYLLLLIIGLIIFTAIFIALNFSSLCLRYVRWDKKQPRAERVFNLMPGRLPLAEKVELYNEPDSIIISKINIRAPLIFAQSDEQKELDADLDKGVVAYPGSVSPGEIGNLFLVGHSSSFPWSKTQYGQVFAKLDKLEKGDRVVIFYNQRKFEYEIENKYLVSPKDLKLVHPDDYSKITLSTCWPIGTDLKRLVAEGKLIK